LAVPGHLHAGAQRRSLALVPAGGERDLGAAEVDGGADALGLVAEHEHHAVQRRLGVGGVERVLQQRAAVEVGELLGPAEPAPGTGREDDPDDQVRTSWMRPPEAESIPPARPWRAATKWRRCWRPSRSTSSATSTMAPSTQPPETAPSTFPDALTSIFDPGGRGAERLTPTTVATATSSPAAVHSCRRSTLSFMRRPVLLRAGRPAPPGRPGSCR